MMLDIIKEKWYFAAAAVVLLAVILIANRYLKKYKEKKEQYQKRLKEQALSEALKNSRGRKNVFAQNNQAAPMETANPGEGQETVPGGRLVVQLSLVGQKSGSYVLNPEDHILLGSSEDGNDIVLPGKDVAPKQCDIFQYKDQVYVKSLDLSFPVELRRKVRQTAVTNKAIRVLTGDQIRIGVHIIQISLMDYKGNLI
ncbi:FHA domain-containing protein [bacterium D16-54]|nr:FHA domain-containing protein [bacterium D16-54]RKJ13341.1 FHA domain-containing protein [bacterium D16-56]